MGDVEVATEIAAPAEQVYEGCRVVESTEDRRGGLIRFLGRVATGVGDREARNRKTMTRTLEQLRAAAEAPAR